MRGPIGDVCTKIHRELKQAAWIKYPKSEHPITIFDGPNLDQWIPLHDRAKIIRGVEVHPIVAGVRLLNINIWQYWRGMHPPFFPAVLTRRGSVSHDKEGWFYESDGHQVFEAHDWRIGNLERIHDDEYHLTGQYALCDPEWLKNYLEQEGIRLAHVLKISFKQRNREYEEPKEFESCRLLNLGSVVA